MNNLSYSKKEQCLDTQDWLWSIRYLYIRNMITVRIDAEVGVPKQ